MRWLRRAFVLFLVLDVLAVGWLAWRAKTDRRFLIEARNAIFARVWEEPALFAWSPAEMVARGFRTDDAARIAQWRAVIPERVDYMDGVLERLEHRPSAEAVRALVPIFSKNGGGGCGDYDDLLHQLRRLPRGDGVGCCSDHVQALLAYTSVLGIFARQVHHVKHTTAEFWAPELDQWVWVDPQMALLARSGPAPDAGYLSLAAIRERYLAGEPVAFEFIGTRYHKLATADVHDDLNYDEVRDFASISIVWGNNVFEEDAFHARWSALPFVGRQFVGMVTGVLPEAHYFEDPLDAKSARMARWQRNLRVAVPVLAAGTLAWPVAALAAAWRRGPRGTRAVSSRARRRATRA